VTDMYSMFRIAYAFNQNLCSWGQKVPDAVDVEGIFWFSGCPLQHSPDNENLDAGPWCHAC
jgi:hypothetical protein